MNWKYVKPLINTNVISDFETQNKIALPQDLKDVIMAYNGGRPSLRFYDLPGTKDKELKTLLSYNPDDLETVYKHYPLFQYMRSIVPFAVDPAGNLLVIDTGKVFFWDHETDELTFVADTFSAFLQMLHE